MKSPSSADPFRRCTTAEGARKVYTRLIRKLHPDVNPSPTAHDDTTRLSTQYQACLKRIALGEIDAIRAEAPPPPPQPPPAASPAPEPPLSDVVPEHWTDRIPPDVKRKVVKVGGRLAKSVVERFIKRTLKL